MNRPLNPAVHHPITPPLINSTQSLWMLFAAFMFAIMGVCVKLASASYSTSEIVMYRGIVGVVFLTVLIGLQGGSFKTPWPWHHLWRGVVGVGSLWLWFYAIGRLPLATATTLNYMAPIWIAAILFVGGLLNLQKKFEWGLTGAIVMSFIGVTMLLQPSIQSDQWFSALMGLGSGLLSAIAYLSVKKLGQMGEPEYRVVFYFSLAGVVAGIFGALAGPGFIGNDVITWHEHTAGGLGLLLGVGVTATVAQMAMTRAYRLGNTLLTANLQYAGIIFSSFWGILIWDDAFGLLGWLGIAVILASGLTATYYNTRSVTACTGKTAVANANDPIASEV